MNDSFEVFDCDVELLALAELGEVDPVILFFLKFETVIKLVHLNVVGVVSLEDFSENPAV